MIVEVAKVTSDCDIIMEYDLRPTQNMSETRTPTMRSLRKGTAWSPPQSANIPCTGSAGLGRGLRMASNGKWDPSWMGLKMPSRTAKLAGLAAVYVWYLYQHQEICSDSQ